MKIGCTLGLMLALAVGGTLAQEPSVEVRRSLDVLVEDAYRDNDTESLEMLAMVAYALGPDRWESEPPPVADADPEQLYSYLSSRLPSLSAEALRGVEATVRVDMAERDVAAVRQRGSAEVRRSLDVVVEDAYRDDDTESLEILAMVAYALGPDRWESEPPPVAEADSEQLYSYLFSRLPTLSAEALRGVEATVRADMAERELASIHGKVVSMSSVGGPVAVASPLWSGSCEWGFRQSAKDCFGSYTRCLERSEGRTKHGIAAEELCEVFLDICLDQAVESYDMCRQRYHPY